MFNQIYSFIYSYRARNIIKHIYITHLSSRSLVVIAIIQVTFNYVFCWYTGSLTYKHNAIWDWSLRWDKLLKSSPTLSNWIPHKWYSLWIFFQYFLSLFLVYWYAKDICSKLTLKRIIQSYICFLVISSPRSLIYWYDKLCVNHVNAYQANNPDSWKQ